MEFSEQEKVKFSQDALKARINNDFTYHPIPAEIEKDFTLLREKAKELELLITELFPASIGKSIALARLEEAVMTLYIGLQHPLEPVV